MLLEGAYIIEENDDGTFTTTYNDEIICEGNSFYDSLDEIRSHYTDLKDKSKDLGQLFSL